MKTPTLIRSIERDLEAGHAAVVQIVSTGEALMERRLADIPTEDWGDVQVDITPREYVLDYLFHSFPTQLFEPFTDGEGNLSSRPVFRDGQPVQCRDAVARRDRLIEHLAALSPVQGALDQIVQRFGTEMVAEITGRSRRIVRKGERLCVENRAPSANLAEAQAFMDDEKRHPRVQRSRRHGPQLPCRSCGQEPPPARALSAGGRLEGRRCDPGPGAQQPDQPGATAAVPADRHRRQSREALPQSTIARRLDTLGAITRGQRQTGGQGLFRADDNLESVYGRAALRQLYVLLYGGKVDGCSFQAFEDATGLRLTDNDGSLREDLPPITTFLNRLLALTIDLQNRLFGVFEDLLRAKIEGAIASGTYDLGVETLTAESLAVADRRTLYVHPQTGAETQVFTIRRRDRNRPLTLAAALERAREPRAALLVNTQSGRAAVQVPAPSLMLDDGQVERRVSLLRPMDRMAIPLERLAHTHWNAADTETFARAWEAELAEVPTFTDSELHIVTGLLLPIWRRLPDDHCRVYRLQTDDGERVIGRLVSPAWVAQAVADDAPDDRARRCMERGARRTDRSPASGRPRASPRQGHGRVPRRALGLHRRAGRSPQGDGPDLRAHHVEAQAVRADRVGWSRHPWCADGSLPAGPPRRQGDGVRRPCHRRLPNWHAVSRVMPRRCAVTISRMAGGKAATGLSAMCGTHRVAVCSCDCTDRTRGKGAAGKWTDAATGEHGDLLDLIALNRGLDRLRDALDEARRFLSLPRLAPKPDCRHYPAAAPSGSPGSARRLFAMSQPIAGTLAEAYLRGRDITTLHAADSLRFHPRCYYRPRCWKTARAYNRPKVPSTASATRGRMSGKRQPMAAFFGLGQRPGGRYFDQRQGSRVSIWLIGWSAMRLRTSAR